MRFPFLDLSIIVPTFHESGNLVQLFRRIEATVEKANLRSEIVVVDDNSRDGTVELCATHQSSVPVRLIVRTDERGLSGAVLRGFQAARGEILLVMDADLSHPPERIPDLVDALTRTSHHDEPAEMVIGSRYVSGGSTTEDWGWMRWINSKVATLAARPFASVKDPMAGYFALRRQSYESAAHLLDPIGYKIGLEMIVKCNFRNVKEVPIEFCNRTVGESKLNLRQQLNYLTHIKRLGAYRLGELMGSKVQESSPAIVGHVGDQPTSRAREIDAGAERRRKAA